jgi:hypothetical protein|tara:strand:- start:4346 stop:5395 length:1050 start_codon:yes stop_codon:yes gene_type:complete
MRDWTNFLGDVVRPFSPRTQSGGYGDFLLGSNPGAGSAPAGGDNTSVKNLFGSVLGMMRDYDGRNNQAPQEEESTFADYLNQAMSIIGEQANGGGGVNYDPQRETLRGQASENDARLEAMYRQLRGSIDADAPVLQEAYDTAIDSTADNSQTAQAQTQQATDAANSRNMEVLNNLGIGKAQGNIIQEGRDLNSQTANQIADQASKGQAAGDRLVSNQASALTHNTNVGNAAGLEGNLQRAQNQARLQALLGEIDMQEQSQNQNVQDNSFSEAMAVAQQMLGMDQYNQQRDDQNQQAAMELAAQQQQPTYDPNAFWQYIDQLQNNGLVSLSDEPNTQIKQLDLYRKLFQG